MNSKPLKRHSTLQPLSRDHHHGLQLCWKIRAGLKLQIEPERIKNYADWFYLHHLLPHFEIEEKYIFPILDEGNDLVKKALAEHRRIRRLFQTETELYKNLNSIEEILESHIRFEERILFNEIQSVATSEQLKEIQFYHSDAEFLDNLTDAFWGK